MLLGRQERGRLRLQIRSPKSEIRIKSQIPNPKSGFPNAFNAGCVAAIKEINREGAKSAKNARSRNLNRTARFDLGRIARGCLVFPSRPSCLRGYSYLGRIGSGEANPASKTRFLGISLKSRSYAIPLYLPSMSLAALSISNYRSIRQVCLPLRPVNVIVGPKWRW